MVEINNPAAQARVVEADRLIARAELIEELVAELGDDWVADGHTEEQVVARGSALRELTSHAAMLYSRAARKRVEVIEMVVQQS